MNNKSIEEQLVDFINLAKKTNASMRRWLVGNKISIYIRNDVKKGKAALTIANAQYNDGYDDIEKDSTYRKYILLIHELNPFNFTAVESAGKELAQWLWENDWQRLSQPMCFVKTRNHGEVSWEVWLND